MEGKEDLLVIEALSKGKEEAETLNYFIISRLHK
jgi:hypothetical protein